MTKETAFLFGNGKATLLVIAASLDEATKGVPPGYVFSGLKFEQVYIIGAWRFA